MLIETNEMLTNIRYAVLVLVGCTKSHKLLTHVKVSSDTELHDGIQ